MIIEENNRYAAANLRDDPHASPWSDVSVDELKAFIGVMGIVVLPRSEM